MIKHSLAKVPLEVAELLFAAFGFCSPVPSCLNYVLRLFKYFWFLATVSSALIYAHLNSFYQEGEIQAPPPLQKYYTRANGSL